MMGAIRIVAEPASDWSWSVGAGSLTLTKHGSASPGWYWTGEFLHPSGFVRVYRQKDLTRIDFITDGRGYSRSWQKDWGDRTINRLAREFVAEILANTPPVACAGEGEGK
jgi:hypothetical protein